MEYVAGLGVIAALIVAYGYFIMDDRRRKIAQQRDSELIGLLNQAIERTGVPKETIMAVGEALAKNLVGYPASQPVSAANPPNGMDSLGLDERTGMDSPVFPDIEYDPWVSQEVQEELVKIDTAPEQGLNGDGGDI